MSISSMTGYGSSVVRIERDGVEFVYFIEIRTVNHRYFKIVSKLPEFLSSLQFDLEGEIRKSVQRGSVLLQIKGNLLLQETVLHLDRRLLRRYLEEIEGLHGEFDFVDRGFFSPLELLHLPGVISVCAQEVELDEVLEGRFRRGFQKALKSLLLMRRKEGRRLLKEIRLYLREIERYLKSIERALPRLTRSYKKRMLQRVRELLREENLSISSADIAREVAIYVDRTDVSEEVTRLYSHLEQFREILGGEGGAVGRKLDFLVQEMLREANTLGAKIGGSEMLSRVVDMKVYIDKIKEQVQNIE